MTVPTPIVPVAPSLTSSLLEDRRRARELYKYFRPDDPWFVRSQNSSSLLSPTSPNVALTAYAQLVALRLNGQRAIISLIDRETMYIVAEATKSINLNKTHYPDKDGQGLWVGCQDIPKAGRLCEWTIALSPHTEMYPLFAINDLSLDDRFKAYDFVTDDPHFRFYAGTPLTTKRGINIGSVYILDDKPREGLSEEQREFLGTMASTVIDYLQTQRDAMVGKKSSNFNAAFNSFVDGGHSIFPPNSEIVESSELRSPRYLPSNIKSTQSSTPDSLGTSSSHSDEARGTKSTHDVEAIPQGHPLTFVRAANILRECMELDEDGGVIFLDAKGGIFRPSRFDKERTKIPDESDSNEENIDALLHGLSQKPSINGSTMSTSSSEPKHSVKVLACSTAEFPICTGDSAEAIKTSHIDGAFLKDLFLTYQKGKLWVFDETGSLSSSEEDDSSRRGPEQQKAWRGRGRQRKELEASLLLQCFPGVRQLLFAPLWDAATAQWFSGCFVWNTVESQVFTSDVELTFLTAFGKTVMAECSRIDTVFADQQKGDFIGSISHELRSPLHGILASSEFLSETGIDPYQRSLADTIDACGRTLLDTINHVLDFSKINSFERNWKKDKRIKERSRGSSNAAGVVVPFNSSPNRAPPLLNIHAIVDVASVTEEVIEGVSAGQLYGSLNQHDIISVSPAALRKGQRSDGTHDQPRLEIILEVEKGDWIFVTQPGALRRVIMNVFGNAVKYTSRGMVRVALKSERLHKVDEHESGRLVTITISDTGKGISPEFLRSKLYTPFAQENSLAPGTGLGLSIVRGIVTLLGGTIAFRSELEVGTIVTISLPLLRPTESSSGSTTSSTMTARNLDYSIDLVQKQSTGKIIRVCGVDDTDSQMVFVNEGLKSLERYMMDWFCLPMLPWSSNLDADIVIVDEGSISEVLTSNPLTVRGILVLCSNAAEARRFDQIVGTDGWHIEYLGKPYGPYKLARAICACLKKVDDASTSYGVSTLTPPVKTPGILTVRDDLEKMDLQADPLDGVAGIQISNNITADEASQNVRRAFNTPMDLEPGEEFPFPDMVGRPKEDQEPKSTENRRALARADSGTQRPHITRLPSNPKVYRIPRILLVDDNKINLRLLQTFMKKRKYELVDCAEDGKMALETFVESEAGYDIIFMDISMPIMNGFEATRAIRDIEEQRRVKNEGNDLRPPAMIIALTGLASGRDQSEAFTAGFDLYITKPASFKDVAKLLDNWETNGEDI